MNKFSGYSLFTGRGEGVNKDSAFREALADSGLNLFDFNETQAALPDGSSYLREFKGIPKETLSAVYSSDLNEIRNKVISAAVGVGVPVDISRKGIVIARTATTKADVLTVVLEKAILELAEEHNLQLSEIKIKSICHKVEKYGAVVAACLLL